MLAACLANDAVGSHLLYLGREHRQHGVASPDNLTVPPESQIGSGQDDPRVSNLAGHIWASLLQDVQGDHTSVHHYMVTHLQQCRCSFVPN